MTAGGTGRLVAVLSTERSGSTLCATMLGAHSRVLAPPELHLLRFPDFESWRARYPPAMASLIWLLEQLGEVADEAAVGRRFAGLDAEAVYAELLARVGPDRFLVDKTPAYARDTETLARLEAFRPLYVWLVRHPLGVAASLHSRRDRRRAERLKQARGILAKGRLLLGGWRERGQDWKRVDLERQLRYWTDVQRRVEAFLAAVPQERWARVHYEELVREPRRESERLCDLLGIVHEPAMLRPRDHAPSALRWNVGDEKLLQHEGIDARVADTWRKRFDERVLDDSTRGLAARLGVALGRTPAPGHTHERS